MRKHRYQYTCCCGASMFREIPIGFFEDDRDVLAPITREINQWLQDHKKCRKEAQEQSDA